VGCGGFCFVVAIFCHGKHLAGRGLDAMMPKRALNNGLISGDKRADLKLSVGEAR